MTAKFFTEAFVDGAALRSAQAGLVRPYASLIDRLIAAQSALEACKAIDELLKVGTQLTFLSLLALMRHFGIELPQQVRKRVRDKWLRDSHDLTEGERLHLIKTMVNAFRNRPARSIKDVIAAAFPDEDFSDWDFIKDFKVYQSHQPSGGNEWLEGKLRDISPHVTNYVRRLEKFSRLHLVSVFDGAGRTLIGAGEPSRWNPKETKEGVYLQQPGVAELVSLDPFVLPDVEDPTSVRLFSGAAQRDQKAGRFTALNPSAVQSKDDGTSLRYLREWLGDPSSEEQELVGLAKQQRELSKVFSDWIVRGRAHVPVLLVVGEEGTGKSSLVRDAINKLEIAPLTVSIAGSSVDGRLDALALQILARLFDVDPGRDVRVREQLRAFCEVQGIGKAARRIEDWLDGRPMDQGSTEAASGNSDELIDPKLNEQKAQNSIFVAASKAPPISALFQDLLAVIRLFGEHKSQKVLLWIEDAQLLEASKDISIESLFHIAAARRDPTVMLLGEFRADRTRDRNRVRDKFATAAVCIETFDLEKSEIQRLLSAHLGIPVAEHTAPLAEEIYQKVGGNPKGTLDLIRMLRDQESNVRDGSDRATRLLLLLPKLIHGARPRELKDIARARLGALSLSRIEHDLLTIMALCPRSEIPVSLMHKILGAECEAARVKLEELGLILECEDISEWRFRFEHLATKEAVLDLLAERDRAEVKYLNDKVIRESQAIVEANSLENLGDLRVCIRKLSEIANDPEHLALTIVGRVISADKSDISQLNQWAAILKRSINPSEILKSVHGYAHQKVKDLEGKLPSSGDEYRRIASRFPACTTILDPVVRTDYVGLCADALSRCMTAESRPTGGDVDLFVSFVSGLSALPAIGEHRAIDLDIALLMFWFGVLRSNRASGVWNALYDGGALKELSGIDQLRVIATAYLVLPSEVTRGTATAEHFQDDLALCKVALDMAREADREKPPKSRKKSITYLTEQRIGWLLGEWLAADRLRLTSTAQQVRTFILENAPWQRLSRDGLLVAAVRRDIAHLDVSEEELVSLVERSAEQILTSPLLRSDVLANGIVECYTRGWRNAGLENRYLENLARITEYEDAKQVYLPRLLNALRVIGSQKAIQEGERLLRGWLQSLLSDAENLEDCLSGLHASLPSAFASVETAFDWVRKARAWKKEELGLIALRKLFIIANEGSDVLDDVKECRKRFDQAKKEFISAFMSPDHPLKTELINAAFTVMNRDIKPLLKGKDSEDLARVREYRAILEHKTNDDESTFEDTPEVWISLWDLMAATGDRDRARRECEGRLQAATKENLRAILAKQAAELWAPDDEEESANPQSPSYDSARADAAVAVRFIDEWHRIEPRSVACACEAVRLAKYVSPDNARRLLALGEAALEQAQAERDLDGAKLISSSLVFSYYEIRDAEAARRAASRALDYTLKIVPPVDAGEIIASRNNFNYLGLVSAIEHGEVLGNLTELIDAAARDAENDKDVSALTSYNRAISRIYMRDFAAGLDELQATQKRLGHFAKTAGTYRCLLFVGEASKQRFVELAYTHLRVASLLCGAYVCLELGQAARARMWLATVFGAMKDIASSSIDPKVWDVSILIAENLNVQIPRWVLKHISVGRSELIDRASRLNEKATTGSVEKTAPCPCGSGKIYRECCLEYLRI